MCLVSGERTVRAVVEDAPVAPTADRRPFARCVPDELRSIFMSS
jgi:hypothetical protein